MKKYIVIFFITYINLFAQTGIGTNTPNASAKLDVFATDKGFLPPRVRLTSVSDASTISSPAVGLLVYNTGSNGLQAGYYYWNGNSWSTIATSVSPNQSVDYIQASLSANQSLSSAGNIIFNTSSGAGITITSGGFNLIANKTYKLEAALGGTSGGYAYYGWADSSNTLLPGGSIGTVMKAGTAYSDAPQDKAVVYYTPTSNTTVFLRVFSVSGGVTAYAPSAVSNYSSTWATVEQIGSSAFVNPWVLSGNDVYNTSGNVGIGNNSPTSKLDVTGDLKVSGGVNVNSPSNINLATPALLIGNSTGDEGGEMRLALAQTNQSLNGNVIIDVYRNQLRLWESGGNSRGVNIDLTKAPNGVGGELIWKTSGIVNAGSFLSLDNLKVSVTTSGNRGLSVGAVSSSFMCNISGTYSVVGGSGGNQANNINYSTSASTSAFAWHFGTEGDMSTYILVDKTNNRMYRVTLVIGSGYNNNFITIERLY